MHDIINNWNWFVNQSLAVQVMVSIGVLNIATAGLKQLGLTGLADLCQKIENALLAMSQAGKTAFLLELKKPVVR